MVEEVNQKELDSLIKKGDLVLVDVYADWCGPCRALSPIIEQLSKETNGAKIVKLDVDNNQEFAARFGIMSVPTVLIFKDGDLIEQLVGLRDKSTYLTLIEEHA